MQEQQFPVENEHPGKGVPQGSHTGTWPLQPWSKVVRLPLKLAAELNCSIHIPLTLQISRHKGQGVMEACAKVPETTDYRQYLGQNSGKETPRGHKVKLQHETYVAVETLGFRCQEHGMLTKESWSNQVEMAQERCYVCERQQSPIYGHPGLPKPIRAHHKPQVPNTEQQGWVFVYLAAFWSVVRAFLAVLLSLVFRMGTSALFHCRL